MNNNLKHLLRYFLLFLIAFPLASCGDDDDTNDEIQTIPRENLFAGTTTTFPVEDPSSVYESSKSTYMVTLNDNGTAVVSINNADFLQGMPELGVMNFRGIKYSIDNSDKESPVITLSCTELTPEIGERPFPQRCIPARKLPCHLSAPTAPHLTRFPSQGFPPTDLSIPQPKRMCQNGSSGSSLAGFFA